MTNIKTLCTLALLAVCTSASAGDGTKDNPYTVSELNAQKEALAASGSAVWVKADLKGLGEDGTATDNADTEASDGKTVHHMAALFGDETGTFVAYSYHILSGIELSDLTNTKGLLISLTYGTAGHLYGNLNNPTYAENQEPTDAHFSLEEVHGALSLEIKNGYRGYHIPACYIVPEGVVAATVNSNYTASKGATINYHYYEGSSEEETYLIPKNSAMVLIAAPGTYDFVLGTGLYPQAITNSNSLHGGTQAGTNTLTGTNATDRWHFHFVASADKVGFERNGSTDEEVVLESKDEIYLTVNSKTTHFGGNWTWETDDKKWISWTGSKYTDYSSGITTVKSNTTDTTIYDLSGRKTVNPGKGIYIQNGKKLLKK